MFKIVKFLILFERNNNRNLALRTVKYYGFKIYFFYFQRRSVPSLCCCAFSQFSLLCLLFLECICCVTMSQRQPAEIYGTSSRTLWCKWSTGTIAIGQMAVQNTHSFLSHNEKWRRETICYIECYLFNQHLLHILVIRRKETLFSPNQNLATCKDNIRVVFVIILAANVFSFLYSEKFLLLFVLLCKDWFLIYLSTIFDVKKMENVIKVIS